MMIAHRVACIRVKLSLLFYRRLCLQDLLNGHLVIHSNTELQVSLTLSVPLALLLDRCIIQYKMENGGGRRRMRDW